MKCPTCQSTVIPSQKTEKGEKKYTPFCSKRCQMIDLGGWLTEKYRIASSVPSEEDDATIGSGELDKDGENDQ